MVPFRRIQPPDANPTRLATQREGVAVQDLADASVKDRGLLRAGTWNRQKYDGRSNCREQRQNWSTMAEPLESVRGAGHPTKMPQNFSPRQDRPGRDI